LMMPRLTRCRGTSRRQRPMIPVCYEIRHHSIAICYADIWANSS
jgi:hypothetical protein